MSSIYASKNDFFSPYEYKMYNLLENLLNNYSFEFGDLAVFSKMRLADIVRLHEDTYSNGGNSFCKNVEKYPYKKGLCDLVEKYMPHFSDEDYKRAFLFPLFRLHTDFLICDHNEGTSKPILAIELHGPEHDKDSEKPDWSRIHNDDFKKSLLDPRNSAMGVKMLVIKNEELDDEEKKMFLDDLGIKESGLEKMIRASYSLLGLISYITSGEMETKAWTIKKGTKAPQAAGKIHSDFGNMEAWQPPKKKGLYVLKAKNI